MQSHRLSARCRRALQFCPAGPAEARNSGDGKRDIPDSTEQYAQWVDQVYETTGDRAQLASLYPVVKNIADYIARAIDPKTGLVTNLPGGGADYLHGIVDWPPPMRYGYDTLWYPVGYATGYLFLLLFIAGPLRRFGAYTIPDFAEGRFGAPHPYPHVGVTGGVGTVQCRRPPAARRLVVSHPREHVSMQRRKPCGCAAEIRHGVSARVGELALKRRKINDQPFAHYGRRPGQDGVHMV